MITNRLLRQVNALRCLRLLQGGRVLSRADMARLLGQTRATVGHAVAELAEAGLVLETVTAEADAQTPPRMGRPGVALRLNPDGAQFLGVEIDTRAISGVILNLDMAVTHRLAEPAGAQFADPEAMLLRVAHLAQALAARTDPARIHGLGIAFPGLVGRGGHVINAPLLGWRDYPLRDRLAALLPAAWTVEVGNDAFAFASAELAASAPDEGSGNLLMVLLAEGIGAAQVSDGKLIGGAHGYAGELGHMRIGLRGRSDKFERLAGAAGFPDHIGQGGSVADGVARLLAAQDTLGTRAALTLWAEALAIGLSNAAHLLDPDRIVLGGPLSAIYPLVAGEVEMHLSALMLHGHARPALHLARFGAEGAAIGAAARLRERLFTLPDLDEAPPAHRQSA